MYSGAIAIILVVGTAILLERFMLDNGTRRYNRKHLVLAGSFGLLSLALALTLELPLGKLFKTDLGLILSGNNGRSTALAVAMFVGVIEESSKFFPLSLFARKKTYLSGVTEGLILFTTVGLVFGVVETLGYMMLNGGARTGFLRFTLLLFFHGALTGIAGFHFAKAHFAKETYLKSWLVLATVAVVHGIYDFTVASGSALVLLAIVITVVVNCYLFWLYYKANMIDSQLSTTQLQPASQPPRTQPVPSPVVPRPPIPPNQSPNNLP